MEQHPLGILIVAAIVLPPFWKLCLRAGYSGWLSLLVLLPLANIIFLYFLAFSSWPSQRRDSDG